MILFSIGLPSRFAEWCDAVTARLSERAWRTVETINVNTLDEVALAVIRTRSPNIVVGSRQPSSRLCKAISETGGRFILALDDPRLALQDLTTRRGLDFIAAVRAVACSCASVVSFAAATGALVLRAGQDWGDPRAIATAIRHHFDLPVSAADVAEIVRNLADLRMVPEQDEHDQWWGGLDEPSRAVANGALEAYVSYFGGGDIGTITWERELFYIAGEPAVSPASAASRPVDLTGPPRCLVFGPYLTLPAGSWSANVLLGFSPEASGMTYIVEIVAGSRLTYVRVQPGAARFTEADLHFSVDQSLEHPVELRVWNERAAIDGRLALGYVTITPHGQIRSDARSFFATALGE